MQVGSKPEAGEWRGDDEEKKEDKKEEKKEEKEEETEKKNEEEKEDKEEKKEEQEEKREDNKEEKKEENKEDMELPCIQTGMHLFVFCQIIKFTTRERQTCKICQTTFLVIRKT